MGWGSKILAVQPAPVAGLNGVVGIEGERGIGVLPKEKHRLDKPSPCPSVNIITSPLSDGKDSETMKPVGSIILVMRIEGAVGDSAGVIGGIAGVVGGIAGVIGVCIGAVMVNLHGIDSS